MNNLDFINTNKSVYIKSCKDIEYRGHCSYVKCATDCPFSKFNSADGKSCEGKYRGDNKNIIIKNAKEFVILFG
jgi:hypothetical protein